MNKKIGKNDLMLIAGLIMVGALLCFAFRINGGKASYAEVSVNGKAVAVLPLDQDTVYAVDAECGGQNHIEIKDGKVCMKDAACPDKLCVHMGHISQNGASIICLPGRVVVKIVDSDEKTAVDAVTG